jgi:hypothetical protein
MEIVDSEGVPIHGDVLQDNRYGPAIPGVDILQNLSDFNQNCFLNSGLDVKGYETYKRITVGNDTCDISDKLTNYEYYQDIRTSDVPSDTVPKLRILLKEVSEINNLSNQFFQKREEKAVEILEKSTTPDNEYSMRLNYINRRKHTANSNTISLIISIVIISLTLFTGGYLYFAGKIKSPMDYAIITLPISILILSLLLGYVFVKDYALFLT